MGYTSSSSATDWASFWYSLGFETTSGSPSFAYTIRKSNSKNKNLPPVKIKLIFMEGNFTYGQFFPSLLSRFQLDYQIWLLYHNQTEISIFTFNYKALIYCSFIFNAPPCKRFLEQCCEKERVQGRRYDLEFGENGWGVVLLRAFELLSSSWLSYYSCFFSLAVR